MKKFELTTESIVKFGRKLFRIKALIDFGNVKEGELGGFVEKEENLSHTGDAWVFGNARVFGNASVSGGAWVFGDARVSGNASVSGGARVFGNASVSGNADILHITGLGTVHRTTTAFRAADGLKIICGCFYGSLKEFEEQVIKTRTGKYREEYLKFAELVEIYFGRENSDAEYRKDAADK